MDLSLPSFVERFPSLDRFIHGLVQEYETGDIRSWEALEVRVRDFFTLQRMDDMEAWVPGWREMASYTDGITLVHITCVFLGMYMLPEFQSLSLEEQDLMKWIILFHDSAKVHIRGKRDNMHAFHSGALAARALPHLGFAATEHYPESIDKWTELTNGAYLPQRDDSPLTPDNKKLPFILTGIEDLFGKDAPAALVVKTVLLHISLHVDDNYPTPAPLTETEIRHYMDPVLFPYLRVMMLSDNEGWSLFDAGTRARQRRDTLAAFEKVKMLIS